MLAIPTEALQVA